MKQFFVLIIAIFSLFSIENNVFAEETSKRWLIENLLNLEYGPITYELTLESLDRYSFRDVKLKRVYTDLVKYDSLTRTAIIDAYKEWSYDYYTTNGLVKNYSNFVYHTNQFFYYLNLIDKKKSLEIR